MQPKPDSNTRLSLWVGLVSLLVGVAIPLELILVALALPSVFATYPGIQDTSAGVLTVNQ